MHKDNPLTLEDYSKFLNEVTVRFTAASVAEDLMRKNILADMLFMGYNPPTRKQRIQWWIEDKKQRAKDIWTILSGGDIHENCGDY